MDITSELNAVGRNFSCTGEVVTYTCSGQGNTLSVNSPPLFNQHAFGSFDTVPDTQLFLSAPNVVLTLLTRESSNYSANLQITMLSDAQLRINVSCSTNNPGPMDNFVIPLIHECKLLCLTIIIIILSCSTNYVTFRCDVGWTYWRYNKTNSSSLVDPTRGSPV